MAKRGPKSLPTPLKIVTGTVRPHRLNSDEPRPELVTPDAPDHLAPQGRAEWDRIVQELASLGLLTRLDRGALAAYCQAWGRWRTAEQALSRMASRDATTAGLMIRTKSGNLIQNPLVGTANKAMADMIRYAAEFGMTPSARTRIRAETATIDPADPAAEFL
ncbi:phage terminase, small subunit, putative, P27 family [Marinovum algicola DG 898]|nr:phage terminase, small subunit, putative, P27 family [Marinovum algicola DG 898]